MSTDEFAPFTAEELAAEGVTALPDKEVISILDLAADIDLAIDGAAPIDLAVALNANIVAPIDAAVSANLLSNGSTSQALADQGVMVNQTVTADAIATGIQDSTIDQSDTVTDGTGATGDRRRRGPAEQRRPTDGATRRRGRRATPRQPLPQPTRTPGGRHGRGGLHRRHPRHARRVDRERASTPPATSSARSTRPPGWSSTPPATSSAASPA